MQYNYSFEIASAIIMCLLLAVNYLNQNLELAKSKLYTAFAISCLTECVMNIASSWGLSRPDLVSNSGNNILCFLFFCAEAATSVLFFMYVLSICETKKRIRRILTNFAFIPFILFLGMIFTNNQLHLIYEMKDNVYSQGHCAAYGYYYIEFFLLGSALVALKGRKTIRGRNRYSVFLAVLVSFIGIVIQHEVKNVLFTSFANTLVLFIFYIVIQNPSEQRDKISNVLNSRAFYLLFENNVNQEKPMEILTIDIRQQTQLNALFGYRNGNIILGEIGNYLTALTGNSNNVFLVSPNVFAVVLNEKQNLEHYKEEIAKRFERRWELDNLETVVAMTMTKISYPKDVTSVKEFYGLFDYLSSVAKRNAMTNYIETTDEIKTKFKRNAQVENAVKKALENSSLQVYFQPIYDIKKERFTSMEALARIFDDELGAVSPDEFISKAEENGMIIPLDLMVLEKTCEFIAERIIPNNEKLKVESVHVNISAQQCMLQNMDDMIISIIDKYRIPHSFIALELTERASLSGADLVEKHMNSLIEQGVGFALDDYGTGNSNCSYLIQYPFTKVKFDKNMVWSFFDSENGNIILDGEMKTIHKLNIPIVAEGIETQAQLEEMKANNVEFIQGYFFSKPLDGESLIKFLMENAG